MHKLPSIMMSQQDCDIKVSRKTFPLTLCYTQVMWHTNADSEVTSASPY